MAGFPTHLQTREGYEILESLQEEIQAGAGQEGDTCSPIAGKARMQPPGSLAATLPGEDHLCRIKSWILRQVMVQGVGLPSPSTPQPSPLTLLWQGELQFSLSPVSPADEPGRLDTTHINILTFACTHTHIHTRANIPCSPCPRLALSRTLVPATLMQIRKRPEDEGDAGEEAESPPR